jgi:hypothetical protein
MTARPIAAMARIAATLKPIIAWEMSACDMDDNA